MVLTSSIRLSSQNPTVNDLSRFMVLRRFGVHSRGPWHGKGALPPSSAFPPCSCGRSWRCLPRRRQRPPFQLTAMAFAIGGLIGLIWLGGKERGASFANRPQPGCSVSAGCSATISSTSPRSAMRRRSMRASSPISGPSSSWFSLAFLPGERLRWFHVAGAALGLLGTVVVVTGGAALSVDLGYLPGYAAAFVAAIVWSTYSVMSRRFAEVPTGAVAGFCLATAALSGIAHLLTEETVWPASGGEWLAVLGLGLYRSAPPSTSGTTA